MHDLALEERLARAWVQSQQLPPSFETAVDEGDEMLAVMREQPSARPGTARIEYLRSGQEAFRALENALAAAGRTLAGAARVLDFACGHGRLTRFLVTRVPAARVTASDIVPGAVDFVAATFGVRGVRSAREPRQVDLAGPFDVIWVGSLFSHLPKARFGAWLERLHGLLADDGVLLFSTHGPVAAARAGARADDFVYLRHSESRRLPVAEYGTTYVTPEFVRDVARAAGIEHVHRLERELWHLQDLYAVTRRSAPGLAAWRRTPNATGRIDLLAMDGERRFRVEGWAAQVDRATPVDAVQIAIDGRDVAAATLGLPRLDVAKAMEAPGWAAAGFLLEGSAAAIPPGARTLAATVVEHDGHRTCFEVLPFDTHAAFRDAYGA